MKIQKFNLNDKSTQLKKSWVPINVETVDGFVLRIAKFKGSYNWHKHKNEDELFFVFKGKIKILTSFGDIEVSKGEGVKIPKGIEHCPIAIQPSIVLMFENSKLKSRGN